MIYHIAVENNVEGRSIAWGLDHPGLFAYGKDEKAALMSVPAAISTYSMWVADHYAGKSWIDESDIEISHTETWETYQIDENYQLVEKGYEINAWFLSDWRPLAVDDIDRGLFLLTWSREDLLRAVVDLSPGKLAQKYPGERWDIAGIIKHIGGAEWWYMDRLGLAFSRNQVPEDPFERIRVVRSHFEKMLPDWVGIEKVVGIEGEFWSPRKIMRRAVWHERDHTAHILGLLEN